VGQLIAVTLQGGTPVVCFTTLASVLCVRMTTYVWRLHCVVCDTLPATLFLQVWLCSGQTD